MKQFRVGILGATGSVGQRFIQLLADHPWFTITEVVASGRSAGKPYHEAVSWKMPTGIPQSVRDLVVKPAEPNLDCDFVFSGLDSSVAGPIEAAFAQAGYPVISNSKNHRMDPLVPLLIADINPGHIEMIPYQQKEKGYNKGFIVTNPNCSTIGLVMALKPIHDAFGIKRAIVSTMQAISGAGFPGVPSMDILENVVPYIGGEEDKIENEPGKILGHLKDNAFITEPMQISASCNRVPVFDGHLESASIELRDKATIGEVSEAIQRYRSEAHELALPSAPEQVVVVRQEPDRPQPRLDRDCNRGMSAVVGRIRECPVFDIRFSVLSHNTIRGAAGVAILNAELLVTKGYIT
ncbi:MAG: aspartate-semialdehyde dehydrogenase [Patescibacteria group bacterium]